MLEGRDLAISQDEKTMAMLAHLLGFFTSFLGPLILYLVRKDSRFVAFHSLQSVFFQLALLVAWTIAGILMFVLIGFLLMPVIFVGELIYIILACIKSFNGEWFEYPLAGKLARQAIGG